METETQLIERSRGGDSAAFEKIVARFSSAIYRYACHMVGDSHAAEDVAQQTFINVYRNQHRFDPDRGSLQTWIYQIARNASINFLRDHKRHRVQIGTALPEVSSDVTPQDQAELREQFELLDQAVAELPEHQRSAWALSELEGLTQSQIATIEDVPEGTVKSRVSRARETLRRTLENRIGMER